MLPKKAGDKSKGALRESARYLDEYFQGTDDHVLLHDLRLVDAGEEALIDHLVFNRGLGIYIIDTKHYAENVFISPRGEFAVERGGQRMRIPSPLDQCRRNERVLQRVLWRLGIHGHTGCQPIVMFHPGADIERPPAAEFDTSHVMRVDQFPTWHEQFVETELGAGAFREDAADPIREWAVMLLREHRPANPPELADFLEQMEAV